MWIVSRIEGLSDTETRANRGEGEGHDGDVFCIGQSHSTTGGHSQTQEHLPQPRCSGLWCGPGASQANQKAGNAKNVDRESSRISLRVLFCRRCQIGAESLNNWEQSCAFTFLIIKVVYEAHVFHLERIIFQFSFKK